MPITVRNDPNPADIYAVAQGVGQGKRIERERDRAVQQQQLAQQERMQIRGLNANLISQNRATAARQQEMAYSTAVRQQELMFGAAQHQQRLDDQQKHQMNLVDYEANVRRDMDNLRLTDSQDREDKRLSESEERLEQARPTLRPEEYKQAKMDLLSQRLRLQGTIKPHQEQPSIKESFEQETIEIPLGKSGAFGLYSRDRNGAWRRVDGYDPKDEKEKEPVRPDEKMGQMMHDAHDIAQKRAEPGESWAETRARAMDIYEDMARARNIALQESQQEQAEGMREQASQEQYQRQSQEFEAAKAERRKKAKPLMESERAHAKINRVRAMRDLGDEEGAAALEAEPAIEFTPQEIDEWADEMFMPIVDSEGAPVQQPQAPGDGQAPGTDEQQLLQPDEGLGVEPQVLQPPRPIEEVIAEEAAPYEQYIEDAMAAHQSGDTAPSEPPKLPSSRNDPILEAEYISKVTHLQEEYRGRVAPPHVRMHIAAMMEAIFADPPPTGRGRTDGPPLTGQPPFSLPGIQTDIGFGAGQPQVPPRPPTGQPPPGPQVPPRPPTGQPPPGLQVPPQPQTIQPPPGRTTLSRMYSQSLPEGLGDNPDMTDSIGFHFMDIYIGDQIDKHGDDIEKWPESSRKKLDRLSERLTDDGKDIYQRWMESARSGTR
jgi:hypothetical protein